MRPVKHKGSYGTLGAVNKRAVITFDLDGTLFHPRRGIHPEDFRLLCSEQPYWFAPATGRPLHSTRALLAQSGLFKDLKLPFPLILQNGAVLYGPREELLSHADLSPAVLEELADRLKNRNHVTILFNLIDAFSPLRVTPFGEECIRRYAFRVQPSPWPEKKPACSKIMCLCEDRAPLEEIFYDTKDLPLERAFSMDSILEFTAAGVNKGSGLQKLLEALEADNLPLLAAGDGENDLEMLKKADISFAPLSSPAEIRRQANRVVDTAQTGLLPAMIAALGS
ncbi:MAG: HAD family phosphatase [Anaerolineae bacterium]|nr:HAD family phosphatase [Anaerolineae bacterium]